MALVDEAARLVAEAIRRKDAGNSCFCRGRFLAKHTAGKQNLSDACIEYAMGLKELSKCDELIRDAGSEEAEAAALKDVIRAGDEVRPALFLNLAAANLLLQEWTPAKACCDEVINTCVADAAAAAEAPPAVGFQGGRAAAHPHAETAAKAFYRRAQANRGIGDLKAALSDLQRASLLRPSDTGIRKELGAVQADIEQAAAREAFKRETERGRDRLKVAKLSAEIEKTHISTLPPETPKAAVGDVHGASSACQADAQYSANAAAANSFDAPLLTLNGCASSDAAGRPYKWSQSLTELRVHVPVPPGTTAKKLQVCISRHRIRVACANPVSAIHDDGRGHETGCGESPDVLLLLEGELDRPIDALESVWMLERPSYVTLYLQKTEGAGGSAAVPNRWWRRALSGGTAIDTAHCCADEDEGASAAAGAGTQPNVVEQQRHLQQQAEAEAAARAQKSAVAMKDPAKAELYRRLRAQYPDIPITIQ